MNFDYIVRAVGESINFNPDILWFVSIVLGIIIITSSVWQVWRQMTYRYHKNPKVEIAAKILRFLKNKDFRVAFSLSDIYPPLMVHDLCATLHTYDGLQEKLIPNPEKMELEVAKEYFKHQLYKIRTVFESDVGMALELFDKIEQEFCDFPEKYAGKCFGSKILPEHICSDFVELKRQIVSANARLWLKSLNDNSTNVAEDYQKWEDKCANAGIQNFPDAFNVQRPYVFVYAFAESVRIIEGYILDMVNIEYIPKLKDYLNNTIIPEIREIREKVQAGNLSKQFTREAIQRLERVEESAREKFKEVNKTLVLEEAKKRSEWKDTTMSPATLGKLLALISNEQYSWEVLTDSGEVVKEDFLTMLDAYHRQQAEKLRIICQEISPDSQEYSALERVMHAYIQILGQTSEETRKEGAEEE